MTARVRRLTPLLIGPFALGAALLAWLLGGLEFNRQEFIDTVRRLAPGTLAMLGGLHVAQQLGRTARLAVLLPRPVPAARLQAIVLLHQFFANLLPMKAGSLSLPELLKREGIDRSQTLATMFTGAGLDLLVTTLLVALAGLFMRAPVGQVQALQQPLLAICLCLLAAAVVALLAARRVEAWFMAGGQHSQPGWLGTVVAWSRSFLGTLGRLSLPRLAGGISLTLVNMLVAIAFSYTVCRQLAPQLSWQAILLIILVMRLASHFSIQGLAGLGTSEALLVLLFCGFGLTASQALAVALLGRGLHLVLVLLGGGIGSLLLLIDRAGPRSAVET
ncbi:MAG: flippase-like domain-containing protein [Pirellulaceae bacterium]|nr:flippase-like domain-containing protein [Pirellulaceae bacterium]